MSTHRYLAGRVGAQLLAVEPEDRQGGSQSLGGGLGDRVCPGDGEEGRVGVVEVGLEGRGWGEGGKEPLQIL